MHTYTYLAAEFSCITREGPEAHGVGATSVISCLASETLVSCGILGTEGIGGVIGLEATDGSYFCQALSNYHGPKGETVKGMNSPLLLCFNVMIPTYI